MNLLIFLVFGAVVGWLASIVMKTNTSQGLVGDVILGILGSLVGGFLMQLTGLGGPVEGFNIYSIIVGVIGAIVLIMLGRMLKGVIK